MALTRHRPRREYSSMAFLQAVRKTKKAIRKAFEIQAKKIGTAFVEVVSTCSSGWKLSPVDSNKWMEENMFPQYPLGDLKDTGRADAELYRIKAK